MAKLAASLTNQFSDWRWRIDNLYYITNKEGRRVQFKMNWAQESLFEGMHFCNVVLKARQLGFTTFIQLFMLDACIFNSNIRAGTVAHRLDDAKTIFRDKVKFPYDNLPDAIRNRVRKVSDSADELVLCNNSSLRVGTSLRSGTLQYLHVSEYGKLCAQFPEKAREVRTGALNTVQAGQVAFIESTAEGQEGHFFELCQVARAKDRMGERLTPLDFKFHFFPWWKNAEYQLDAEGVTIGDGLRQYFETLSTAHGIELSDRQRAWYSKKQETQLADMKREYPSTPDEAFEAAVEGAYYAEQLATAELQGRMGVFKADPELPVNTAWDLGIRDGMAVWFWQNVLGKIAIVGYYENTGEGLPFYVDKLKEYSKRLGWRYGSHLFPHDVKVKELGTGRTRVEQLISLGVGPQIVALHKVEDGIQAVRASLPICHFDQAECSEGLKSLKSYRREWDEGRGCWRDKPRHDWASHGADAFRVLAMGWRETQPEEPPQTPADIVAEMCKPRTFAALLAEYDREQEEMEN